MKNQQYLKLYLQPVNQLIKVLQDDDLLYNSMKGRIKSFLEENSEEDKQIFVKNAHVEFGDEVNVAIQHVTLNKLQSIKSSLLFIKIVLIVSLCLAVVAGIISL